MKCDISYLGIDIGGANLKIVGVNEDKTSLIKKSNLEIKNLFSKLGIFLIG